MDYKERLKQYLEEDIIYSEYKNGKCDMSDFDKYCIEHCKDIECLLNENEKQKEVIDKLTKTIYEIDELRKTTGGYPSNYIDNLLDTLKEVE